MKHKLAIALLLFIGLAGCSLWPGGDDEVERKVGETKTVEEELDEQDIDVELVYISKGRLQCEDETGNALSVTKDQLQSAGIRVFSAECGVITGIMPPALCGSTTLHINIHGIDERKIPDAEVLGYKSVKSFEKKRDYEIIPCN